MQDTVTSRELFERMPTRPALAEPEVAAHKVRSYEDDSTDWAPSGGRAAAPEQREPARRRPVRSTRNRDLAGGAEDDRGTAPKGRRRSSASARSCGLNSLPSRRSRATPTALIRAHIYAVRVKGNIFAAQPDALWVDAASRAYGFQAQSSGCHGSVVVMTPCAVHASAFPGFSDLTHHAAAGPYLAAVGGGPALWEPVRREASHDPCVGYATSCYYPTLHKVGRELSRNGRRPARLIVSWSATRLPTAPRFA